MELEAWTLIWKTDRNVDMAIYPREELEESFVKIAYYS